MTIRRHILGISDSKSVFVSPHEDPLLVNLIRKHTIADKTSVPTICYIGAAKGDRPDRIADFLIEQAEDYDSVIELPAGVAVELVFVSGSTVRDVHDGGRP